MAVSIKSEREIELMREAGKLLAKTHLELEKELHPGMTTKAVDRIGDYPQLRLHSFLLEL